MMKRENGDGRMDKSATWDEEDCITPFVTAGSCDRRASHSNRGKRQLFVASSNSQNGKNDSFLLPEAILKMGKMTAFCCLKQFSKWEKWQLFVAWSNSQNGKNDSFALPGGSIRKGKITALLPGCFHRKVKVISFLVPWTWRDFQKGKGNNFLLLVEWQLNGTRVGSRFITAFCCQ